MASADEVRFPDSVGAPAEEQPDARESWPRPLHERVRALHVHERNGYGPGDCHCDECCETMDDVREHDLALAALRAELAVATQQRDGDVARLQEQLDAANRETGEYRRMWEETLTKLDAATKGLERIAVHPHGGILVNIARAALGVVAAAEIQKVSGKTLDSAPSQTEGRARGSEA